MGDLQAFIFGGIAALLAFGAVALFFIAIGGWAKLDLCSGALLFIAGGVIGIVVNYIRLRRRGDL